MKTAALFISSISAVAAFPWVVDQAGVDSSLLKKRQQSGGSNPGGPATCPFNSNHAGAAPFNPAYPYNSAQNGLPGKGKGGYQVPAPGDTSHYYVPAGANDIRGPCPGLNAAANHNFLSHDGITTASYPVLEDYTPASVAFPSRRSNYDLSTLERVLYYLDSPATRFNELVDAQQNLYNVGYDLAVLLAALGLTLTDGDLVTEKLSIGCDATTRTSVSPLVTGAEPGLDGHNKFEADTSLTRNDYFLGNGDNFSFNSTLFGMMTSTCSSNYNLQNLATYRLQRYNQSKAQNPNFYFGPLSLLLYGAASFLYELMPSGPAYSPDFATISSFFGAESNSNGGYNFVGEKIPANWTNRLTPYTNTDVTTQILEMYLLDPVLFGGNTANGTFDALPNFGEIQNGKLVSGPNTACLLYQLATQSVPSYLNGFITPTVDALNFITSKVAPQFANLGCPIALT